MDTIKVRRQILRRIKRDLQETFAPAKEVKNIDNLFIISDTTLTKENFVKTVYTRHMETDVVDTHCVLYFDVLALNPGYFVGEHPQRAYALQATFGGTVTRTENRHIAEWLWVKDDNSEPLDEEEAVRALFNIV